MYYQQLEIKTLKISFIISLKIWTKDVKDLYFEIYKTLLEKLKT